MAAAKVVAAGKVKAPIVPRHRNHPNLGYCPRENEATPNRRSDGNIRNMGTMSLLTWNVKSAALGMATHVSIALPDEGQPRKTLFLLHGLTGTHTDWLLQGNAYRLASDRNIAIVMPDGQRSFYLDQPHSLHWETWIAKELPELLEQYTKLPMSREDLAVAGLSMGGYGAMRLGLRHPDRFHAAISLSGTLDITEKAFQSRHPDLFETMIGTYDVASSEHDLLRWLRERRELPRLWACCGEDDRLLDQHHTFVKTAQECGHELTHYTAPGEHTWKFWNEHLPHALDWWLEA